MARGFGATDGVGSTDVIDTGVSQHAAQRTYAVRWLAHSNGPGAVARLINKDTAGTIVETMFIQNNAGNEIIAFRRQYSGGDGIWFANHLGFEVWHNVIFTLDDSAAGNTANIWINGNLATLAGNQPSIGTVVNNANNYLIGNRSTADRNFDGTLEEVAIWDRILTDDEIRAITGDCASPLVFPRSLRSYFPLVRDVKNIKGSTVSVTGTAVKPHGRVYYPGVRRNLGIQNSTPNVTIASSTTPVGSLRKQINTTKVSSTTPITTLVKLLGVTLTRSTTTPISILQTLRIVFKTLTSSTTPISNVFALYVRQVLIQSVTTPISAIFTDVTRIPPNYVTGIRRYITSKLFSERVHRTRYIEDGE
jgi:hypothetical protein